MTNSSNTNSWTFTGEVRLNVQLRQIGNGKTMLPLTMENGSVHVSFVCFSPLSDQLAGLQQGQTISVNGYMKNRKCDKCGHYHVNLIAKQVSLDNGRTWLSDDQQPQQIQGHQQQQGQQQSGFKQPLRQSQQHSQPQQNQPQQSRDEFLSSNQYRQQSQQSLSGQQGSMADLLNNRSEPDDPVSPEGMRAQESLYSQNQPINTPQQAQESLQRYQNHVQQAPTQDDSNDIDFGAANSSHPF